MSDLIDDRICSVAIESAKTTSAALIFAVRIERIVVGKP
jgi:hypothetical protein